MLVRIMTSWDGGDIEPDVDGFVHLSRPEQVVETIQRHHAGAASLTLLLIDEAALPQGALRVEQSGTHGAFPHLYATLPANAIIRALPWRPGAPIPLLELEGQTRAR